jgi:hypothetical protein
VNNNELSPQWLLNFVTIYQSLHTGNVDDIRQIYHRDIIFEDPLHRVEGLDNLLDYFNKLYQNLSYCQFIITDSFYSHNRAAVYWVMSFKHANLNGGELVEVIGHTHLKGINDKVTYHRDYLDAGAMLYEHIPVLGSAIRFVKKRASQ